MIFQLQIQIVFTVFAFIVCSFYVCFHPGKLDKRLSWNVWKQLNLRQLLYSYFLLRKLESRGYSMYLITALNTNVLFFGFAVRNWYRMLKMLVPQRLGFYMMKLSMEQKLCGQRTWHNIRVNILINYFGCFSICLWFCDFLFFFCWVDCIGMTALPLPPC